MPRPRKPGALTGAERAKASRERRQIVSHVELTPEMLDGLNGIRQRDGDASNAAVVRRLIEKEKSS